MIDPRIVNTMHSLAPSIYLCAHVHSCMSQQPQRQLALHRSYTMDDFFHDLRHYRIDLLPAWQLNVWRQISLDASARGAFPAEDFQGDCLKPYQPPYRKLFRWLVSVHTSQSPMCFVLMGAQSAIDDPSMFNTLIPFWEHIGHGDWRLLFAEREDWVHVRHWGSSKAVCSKQVKVKCSGRRPGIIVAGLEPE